MVDGWTQLIDWMARRDVNQRETARLLSMDFTVLNKIVTGERRPSLETAVTIERCTGIPVEAWLPTAGGDRAEPVPVGGAKRRIDKE